ncbi:MAG: hypothetical protein JOZ41_00815, partial [Chloroflexi bacterium]|nr:hypothetical protein [Chloroflexota bacterium]
MAKSTRQPATAPAAESAQVAPVQGAPPRSSAWGALPVRLMGFLLPAIVVALFLAAWQWVPGAVGLHRYELPNLTDTLTGLHDDWQTIGTS